MFDRSHDLGYRRVLVLGLDMGDGGLIRAWIDRGRLRNLANLIKTGTWLDLETPAAALHTATWPTFATGRLPGEHGVYFPYQIKPGLQQAKHIEADQYHCPTFWAQADRQGRRCLVYDVPETFPETGFGGRAIFDRGTFAWYGTPSAQPAGLMQDLKAKFGSYPLGFEAKKLGLQLPDRSSLEARLLESISHKRESLQWLMEREPWDLVVAGFCETHPAGHYLWPSGGTDLPSFDSAAFEPLLRVYEALDEAVGALAESLPDDAVLMLTSGDGVKPNHAGWHLLPEVLERLGYCAAPGDEDDGVPAKPRGLLARVKDAVPAGGRRWIADRLPWWLRDKIGAQIQAAQIDWQKTKAFTLPTDLEGYIRINLAGREPEGQVAPGEYDSLCREIAAMLLELRNPATGETAVREVFFRNEIFPGPAQEHLPDLMVAWNDSTAIEALESERLGRVAGASQDKRSGTHSPEGFLLAWGREVPAGKIDRGRLRDVGPTVLSLLNIAGASDSGGRLPGIAELVRTDAADETLPSASP